MVTGRSRVSRLMGEKSVRTVASAFRLGTMLAWLSASLPG